MQHWAQLREEFPALATWTYLDTASFGQLPHCASEAILNHLAHRDHTASSQFLTWFDDMDRIRGLCARLIHGSADDIAFVPSASTGLAYLMQGLDWEPGDELLTLEGEFPNQLYQSAHSKRFGTIFRAVPWPEFYSSLTDRTRNRGILLYLDGTQSVGALQMDVSQVQPSMLCVDAYKWLMSPNGAGFVYVSPELRRTLAPSVIGWRSDAGWRAVNSLNHGVPAFSEAAEKYEGGMIPFPSLYALGAVIEMLLTVGPANIEARVLELAAQTRAMLTGLGAEVDTNDSQIVTARLPGGDPSDLALRLKAQKIVISARHGRLRISPHFYNDQDDMNLLRDALTNRVLG